MTAMQRRFNYHCRVTKISSEQSQKSFKIPELFERQLFKRDGRRSKICSNTLYSVLGKKLYWQSASCTVQTSYGLWNRFSTIQSRRTQYTYTQNDTSTTSRTVNSEVYSENIRAAISILGAPPADSRDGSDSFIKMYAVVKWGLSVPLFWLMPLPVPG